MCILTTRWIQIIHAFRGLGQKSLAGQIKNDYICGGCGWILNEQSSKIEYFLAVLGICLQPSMKNRTPTVAMAAQVYANLSDLWCLRGNNDQRSSGWIITHWLRSQIRPCCIYEGSVHWCMRRMQALARQWWPWCLGACPFSRYKHTHCTGLKVFGAVLLERTEH